MKITTTINYIEEYLPSPRHRKMREREVSEKITVHIGETEYAPVALTTIKGDEQKEYLWYKGELYVKKEGGLESLVRDTAFYGTFYGHGGGNDRETVKGRVEEYCRSILIIAGEVYRQASEPIYTVYTFGLGNNHGGTALMLGSMGYDAHSYSFSALQREKAIEFARRIAKGRGDTDSVERIGNGYDIIVHIPEAVKADPQAKAKENAKKEIMEKVNKFLADAVTEAYAEDILGEEGLDEIVRETLKIADYDSCGYFSDHDIRTAIGEFLLKKVKSYHMHEGAKE